MSGKCEVSIATTNQDGPPNRKGNNAPVKISRRLGRPKNVVGKTAGKARKYAGG